MISLISIRILKYNTTTNKVYKFRILYTFEDCELKYTLKMIASVGSTNILYRFMNTSVSLRTLPNFCELYRIRAAVTKLFNQSANGLIDVKRII